MGYVEAQVDTGSEVKLASGGQIVANLRKQVGVEHAIWWPVSAVN